VTVNRDDSADAEVDDDYDTNTHELEGDRMNVDGDHGQKRSTSGNYSDTTVVDCT